MQNDSGATWQEWDGGSNIGETERLASIAGGALLAVFGLARRSRFDFFPMALGAFLLARGLTRRCPIYEVLGVSTGDDENIFGEDLPATN